MKEIKYIILLLVGGLLASCMGADYVAPQLDNNNSPWGNNEIKETNLITIAQLKDKYKASITGNSYEKIKESIQIKGIVTGNDDTGNIYQEISLQDKTGALLICISGSGLYGYLPVGQEVLISLDSLYIGGYGQQAEIGDVYTNTNSSSSNYGTHSIGRMDRYIWNQHFKLIGTPNRANADSLVEDFNLAKASDANYLSQNAGKLMTIHQVTFKDANGQNVYAPDDGSVTLLANAANRALRDMSGTTPKNISTSTLVVRTSTFADFANTVLPKDTLNITGVFTRYNNTWQILLRDASIGEDKDLAPGTPLTLINDGFTDNPFTRSTDPWTIQQDALPPAVSYVWGWNSTYGMKASAYWGGVNYETHSRAVSPAINLTKKKSAQLTISHASKFFGDATKELLVQVSTDKQTWQTVNLSAYPTGKDWNFIDATADLTPYCGKTVYICFYYNSSTVNAATWEVRSITIQ